SAQDVSEGGLGVTLAECVFSNKAIGATCALTGDATVALFSETQSRFVVSVRPEHKEAFESAVRDAIQIGTVTEDETLTIDIDGGTVIDEESEQLHTI